MVTGLASDRSTSVFWLTGFLIPDAKSKKRRVLSGWTGMFGSIVVSRSASSVRRYPFAVPLIDQNAGAVGWIVAIVFQAVGDGPLVILIGTWFPVAAWSGIKKSTV